MEQDRKLLGRQSDVESIINISNICVLTTNVKIHGEGISNSILEYMAMGKPVIASCGGGTNEIVEDAVTGFLISPLSPRELAEKIEILIDNPEFENPVRPRRHGKNSIRVFDRSYGKLIYFALRRCSE